MAEMEFERLDKAVKDAAGAELFDQVHQSPKDIVAVLRLVELPCLLHAPTIERL